MNKVYGVSHTKITAEHTNVTKLPGNASQWSPEMHTGPFCDGNSDDYRVSESPKGKRTNL